MSPSPDPPRSHDEHHPEDSEEGGGGFIAVWDDEDIWGNEDGPYELDIGGSEGESDLSEDERPEGQDNNEGDVDVTARGRYQVLVQFAPSDSEPQQDEPNPLNNDQRGRQVEGGGSCDGVTPEEIEQGEEDMITTSIPVMRDIPLSEEKVQVIKSVMKNFTLPSIPSWAEELSEDAWRSQIFQSIRTKDKGGGSGSAGK